MRIRVALTTLTLAGALLLWIAWVAANTYIRAPRMVAELDRAGALPYSPAELSRSRLCALLAVDDPTFYRHQGIGLADGPPGHTTITQAIGKGLFFNEFHPGFLHHQKIRLMVAAWAFDRRISKETQLRIFLNRAYFGSMNGREVLGFPAAARAFFDKPMDRLLDKEYLALLAMLEAPNRYHVLRNPNANFEPVVRFEKQVERACRDGCYQGDRPVPCGTADSVR